MLNNHEIVNQNYFRSKHTREEEKFERAGLTIQVAAGTSGRLILNVKSLVELVQVSTEILQFGIGRPHFPAAPCQIDFNLNK